MKDNFSTFLFQQCDKATHGKVRLYQNKLGDDEVLICGKKNGVYRWRFIDGKCQDMFKL